MHTRTTPLRSYKELVAWQQGIALVSEIYRVTQGFPKQEMYGLTNQVRRAAVSIPSNIAEGQGRLSRGEFRQFLGHARGSIFELESQILIARNLGYLVVGDAESLFQRITELAKVLNGLLRALEHSPQSED